MLQVRLLDPSARGFLGKKKRKKEGTWGWQGVAAIFGFPFKSQRHWGSPSKFPVSISSPGVNSIITLIVGEFAPFGKGSGECREPRRRQLRGEAACLRSWRGTGGTGCLGAWPPEWRAGTEQIFLRLQPAAGSPLNPDSRKCAEQHSRD